MNTEIFIESFQADLSKEVAALFTYAVDDVKDFAARNTNFSKTIILPGSSRNNRIFGHAFEFGAFNDYNPSAPNLGANYNAAIGARCLVFIGGLQIFKGIIRLLSINSKEGALEYECAVFGELGGLITGMRDKRLQDLDFSQYDQAWTKDNIAISWTNSGSGVFYPLIEYGGATTNDHDYQFKTFRPALFVKEYVDKIIADAGYTYYCPFFSGTFFSKLIIPHAEDQVYKLVQELIKYQGLGQTTFLRGPNTIGSPLLGPEKVRFTTFVYSNLFTVTGLGNQNFTYSGVNPISVSIAADLYLKYGGGENKVTIYSSIRVNTVPVVTHSFVMDGDATYLVGQPYPKTRFVQMYGGVIALNPGDTVTIECYADVPVATYFGEWAVGVNPGSEIRIGSRQLVAAPAQYGNTLAMNNMIPKGYLQSDFLSSICKMFNLYIVESKDTEKHLEITPYPDFYTMDDRDDWTMKVDRRREIKLKPMSEVNARVFNFLYEKDTDYFNEKYQKIYSEGYGDYRFDTGLEFVQQKKDLKVIFAGSPLIQWPGEDKHVTAIYKDGGAGGGGGAAIREAVGSKIRILQTKQITGVSLWYMQDGPGILDSYTEYGYAGHLDDPAAPTNDLSFGAPLELFYTLNTAYPSANLFNAFYAGYMAEICDKDSKLLSCYVDLKGVDINQLDFARPKVIDGAIWRLNKVIDYNPVEAAATLCEFSKIINLAYE